jgi:hypothetical protein
VIFEPVVNWNSCHANVNAGLQWVPFRIQPYNGRMLRDGIAQQNYVNVMVKSLFFLTVCCCLPVHLRQK